MPKAYPFIYKLTPEDEAYWREAGRKDGIEVYEKEKAAAKKPKPKKSIADARFEAQLAVYSKEMMATVKALKARDEETNVVVFPATREGAA